MKNSLLSLLAFLLVIYAQSQVTNINPDPNGDPWIVGGLRELSLADYDMLDKIPRWKPNTPAATKDLPLQVDNTVNPWFRPIFSQSGGSCGQASGVGYNFTYEIDYERQVSANTAQNQYPTHFTWNFLNGGVGGGSWYFDGWMIINEAGCPTVADYGGIAAGGSERWMTGYDLYYNAMFNRTLDFYAIDVSNHEGLETLKQWLYSRDGGTLPGGLVNFGAGIGQSTMSTLPSGTPQAGKPVVIEWGTSSDHAMTFVGYDDEIRFDFNNDGQYTDDIDINGDGEVNLRDCEVGGLVMANSWGTGWGFSGKAYVMYKLLPDPIEEGGIWSNAVHLVQAKPVAEPLLTIKATIKHTSRNMLKLMAGVSSDPGSENPEKSKSFPMFHYQGGDHYMQGGSSNADKTIEIGLDITDLLTYVEPGQESRFFLQVVEQDPYFAGDGEVISYSIIDYSNGVEEVICTQENIPIANSDTTCLWVNKVIDFDKVQVITEELDPAMVFEPYSFQLDAANGTPPYEWSFQLEYAEEQIIDPFPSISANQLQPSNDDDGFAMQSIEFDFPFYGKTYNELTILTDGAITFDGNFSYIRENPSIMANRCIAAYCSDLMIYPAMDDGIFYEGDETHATFRWRTSKFDNPSFFVDVVTTLYPDGSIQFFYANDITSSTEWSSGISNGDGSSYLISAIAGSVVIPSGYASQVASAPFPLGMEISPDGLFHGTPTEADMTWDITFKVTDYNRISNLKTITFSTEWVAIGDLNVNAGKGIEVYPNPFTTYFDIEVTGMKGDFQLQLLDPSGRILQTVYDGQAENGTFIRRQANTNLKLKPGVYYLNWKDNLHSGTVKVVFVD
jgi:hypothetical protein